MTVREEIHCRLGFASGSADRRTDVALAIDAAVAAAATAPFAARRTVVNILANGSDNSGAPVAPARRRALALGMTLNAVVLGRRPEVLAYFRRAIVGGPGAFTLDIADAAQAPRALKRKFFHDLIAASVPHRSGDGLPE